MRNPSIILWGRASKELWRGKPARMVKKNLVCLVIGRILDAEETAAVSTHQFSLLSGVFYSALDFV